MKKNSPIPEVKVNWLQKLLVVGMAIVILTATGPFGTYEQYGLFARFVYWSLAVIGVGTVMNAVAWYSLRFAFVRALSWPWRMILWVLVGSVPGSIVMISVVTVFSGFDDAMASGFLQYYYKLCMISAAICLTDLRQYAFAGYSKNQANDGSSSEHPPGLSPDAATRRKFLNQLRHEVGDDIISISTQDHYLDVTTPLGRDLIHGKMSEAAKQLESLPGVRLHRSHWVAVTHISRLQRNGAGHVVILSDGREFR